MFAFLKNRGYNGNAMKINKVIKAAGLAGIMLMSSGFESDEFSLKELKDYQREFKSQSIGACSSSPAKTYEDYRMITAPDSRQYWHIKDHMTVDEETGFLYDEDGFIGVALGYHFGDIGTRYYIVLDTGIIVPVVKIDAKAAVDASNGCTADLNGSVIEFVIDSDKALEYFGGVNGYAANGNFDNYEYLNGRIADFELVLDEKIEDGVVYETEIAGEDSRHDETTDDVRMVKGGY